MIEHVPDLVTWLQEIAAILQPAGEVRLAVPDRRFTFDILRRESTLADALDAFIRRPRAPLPRAILDHLLNCTAVDAAQAWRGELQVAELQPGFSAAFAFDVARKAFLSGNYQDAHCWVFTPASFAVLGLQLARLSLLPLACMRIYPTDPGELEFIVRLRHCTDPNECAETWRAQGARLATADASVA